jgi:WD40 repeat protein
LVTSLALSPDGEWLYSGFWDNTISKWHTTTGQIERVFEGHSDWVTSFAVSPDGEWLYSGSYDNTIRKWNTTTGQIERVYEGHCRSVESLALSSDGEWLYSGSDDKTIKRIDLKYDEQCKSEIYEWMNMNDTDRMCHINELTKLIWEYTK